jgi:hypothetical protein
MSENKQRNPPAGRPSRDMVMWTLYLPRSARDLTRKLAEAASVPAGRLIRSSAVGRALIAEALADPALVERAVARAVAEPPSGKARLREDT